MKHGLVKSLMLIFSRAVGLSIPTPLPLLILGPWIIILSAGCGVSITIPHAGCLKCEELKITDTFIPAPSSKSTSNYLNISITFPS
jgi:hypothetical protein